MTSLETSPNGTAVSWIKISEASKISSLSQPTLYQMIQQGRLPVQRKKIEDVLHLDKEAFETWVKHRPSRRRRSRSETAEAEAATATEPARTAVSPALAPVDTNFTSLTLPMSPQTNLDFWLRMVRFVRRYHGQVALQTDGTKTVMVGEK